MNLYAYVGNDPVNWRDSRGLLRCRPRDRRCNVVEDDAARAIRRLAELASLLKSIADKGGRRLSRRERTLLEAFETIYGEGSATPANLMRIASLAVEAGSWLDSDSTLVVWGGDGGARAEYRDGNLVIYDGYFSHPQTGGGRLRERSSWNRQGALIHEGGHAAGLPSDAFIFLVPGNFDYSRPYYRNGLTDHLQVFGTAGQLQLADAFRCVASLKSSDCPLP